MDEPRSTSAADAPASIRCTDCGAELDEALDTFGPYTVHAANPVDRRPFCRDCARRYWHTDW